MEYLIKHGPTTVVAVAVSYLFNIMVVGPLYEERFATKAYVEAKTDNRYSSQDHEQYAKHHEREHDQSRQELIDRLNRIELRQQAFFQILTDWSRAKYGEDLKNGALK